MLLQSLIALSAGDGNSAALSNLTTQLADITVSCDRLMETMVGIADQRIQIQKVQDVHISSALAMALRKLNGSYAKRTTELREAKVQVDQLKAELEEAWRVAEDMAQEMDDLNNFHSGFSDSDEDGIHHVHDESVRLAEVMNITGTAVATKATLTNILTDGRNKEFDRSSRVSAARKRSMRASKASLRIPKSPSGAATPTAGTHSDRASIFSHRSRKDLRSRSVEDITVPPVPPLTVDVPTRAVTPTPLSPNRVPTPAPELDVSLDPEPALKSDPEPTEEQDPSPPTSAKENFLEMSPTRPGSPSTPSSPAKFSDVPPVPLIHIVTSHDAASNVVPDLQCDTITEFNPGVVPKVAVVPDITTTDAPSDSRVETTPEDVKGLCNHDFDIGGKLTFIIVDEGEIQEVPRYEETPQQDQQEDHQREQQQPPPSLLPEQQSQRPPTLNFDIPPITLNADDEVIVHDHSSDKTPTRSQSMVEPRTRSVDDTDIVPKRAKSEHKRFDGWPWQLARKTKRYSMPLTRLSLDSAKGEVQKDKKKDKRNASSSTLTPLVEASATSESSS